MEKFRIKFYDWLWWNFGFPLWKFSACNHPETEVKRRLGWMTLDCRENDDRWRTTPEGRKFLIEGHIVEKKRDKRRHEKHLVKI